MPQSLLQTAQLTTKCVAITKCRRTALSVTTCTITSFERTHYNLRPQILQNAAALITKCVSWMYYKMLHTLLHNVHIIAKCRNRYYKICNLLQNASLLKSAAEH